jgi:hypothetical protein
MGHSHSHHTHLHSDDDHAHAAVPAAAATKNNYFTKAKTLRFVAMFLFCAIITLGPSAILRHGSIVSRLPASPPLNRFDVASKIGSLNYSDSVKAFSSINPKPSFRCASTCWKMKMPPIA